jgi:hypothetical protein
VNGVEAMVYWIICRDGGGERAEPRYGPFESEAVARRELAKLKTRFLGAAASRFQLVCDFA